MKYYIQRAASGYVGNCLIWWKMGGHGYGCNISEAEVFDGNDPKFISIIKDKKYRAWPKDYIDSRATLHVDSENIDFDLHDEFKKYDPDNKIYSGSLSDKINILKKEVETLNTKNSFQQ